MFSEHLLCACQGLFQENTDEALALVNLGSYERRKTHKKLSNGDVQLVLRAMEKNRTTEQVPNQGSGVS